MSSWLRPTTADVGLRSFAASKERLFEETTAGMQDYLLASEIPSEAIHHTSVWTVRIPTHNIIKPHNNHWRPNGYKHLQSNNL